MEDVLKNALEDESENKQNNADGDLLKDNDMALISSSIINDFKNNVNNQNNTNSVTVDKTNEITIEDDDNGKISSASQNNEVKEGENTTKETDKEIVPDNVKTDDIVPENALDYE